MSPETQMERRLLEQFEQARRERDHENKMQQVRVLGNPGPVKLLRPVAPPSLRDRIIRVQ